MALTNPQYDAIMRMYNERQLRHQREQQEHIRIAYEKIPRLAEIDAEIASLSVRKAKAMLNGDTSMDLDLNAAIRDRSQERAALLSMHGYPADYLELTYDCPLCRDTGYINGTQKCACFKKAAVDLLYRQSNVEELLKTENFSQFSLDYYSDSLTNSFVSSQLFLCINERILRKKSTIISTNLPLDRFMETYSERTFSRISSNYTIIKLFGNDIRIQKKLLGGTKA